MFLDLSLIDQSIRLPAADGTPEQVHVFSEIEIRAVNAALAARRALLVRGEPGTGKTQLAKAVAVALGRAFVVHTVDARTDARDLLWHFDAVSRLAEAQMRGALGEAADRQAARADLRVHNFIQPRALWWALHWSDAEVQAETSESDRPQLLAGCDPKKGVVVLIDEIDKADSEVPNGLLEVLGAGQFTPQGFKQPVTPAAQGIPPLVVITTNEERPLPDAFLRRCLVLHLELPQEPQVLKQFLIDRGRAHFGKALSDDVLQDAATLLQADRDQARRNNWRPYPGQAEFLDLLRAVEALAPGDAVAQAGHLNRIKDFALRKSAEAFAALPKTKPSPDQEPSARPEPPDEGSTAPEASSASGSA